MRIFRILLRVLGVLGAMLLTLLTLAVSAVNVAMVTPYWAMVVLGGTGLFLVVALLTAGLTRLFRKAVAWKAVGTLSVIACVFLAQVPLYFLFNTACSFTVRVYAARQLPQLEAYNKEHGRYPGTLDEVLKDEGVIQKLMNRWASYSVYNERSTYRVSVKRPVASGQYVLDPVSKAWEARK